MGKGAQQMSTSEQRTLEHGDIRKDGWVYVGVDEGGSNLFAKGSGVTKWREAMSLASSSEAHLGTDHELELLYKNIVNGVINGENTPQNQIDSLKGVFDVSGSNPSGWVWGARLELALPQYYARIQRLSDGVSLWGWQDNTASTILFRSEPATAPAPVQMG